MSLINDALKRAREAQQNAPTPAGNEPHFRPPEPEPRARHNLGLVVPVALALVALGGLALAWQLSHRNGASEVEVVAAKSPPADPVASPPVTPVSAVPAAVAPATVPVPAEVPKPVKPVAKISNPGSNSVTAPVSTNIVVAAPVVAEPPPPRLQSIVFNPRRPSAMIDGQVLFVGDRLRAFRIVAITPETVKLAKGGITNTLSLSE